MTVPATSFSLPGNAPESRSAADDLLKLAAGDDFARWETQLTATGNCANPVRLRGRIDAIDRATGEKASIYDTASEPGGVLRIPCGNRREEICPPCSEVYKGDARQLIRAGLTGGKGIPETVATHPCVFATVTASGFGPVHTIRTGRPWPQPGMPSPPRCPPAALPPWPRPVLPSPPPRGRPAARHADLSGLLRLHRSCAV